MQFARFDLSAALTLRILPFWISEYAFKFPNMIQSDTYSFSDIFSAFQWSFLFFLLLNRVLLLRMWPNVREHAQGVHTCPYVHVEMP